jgi:hypothetical protein
MKTILLTGVAVNTPHRKTLRPQPSRPGRWVGAVLVLSALSGLLLAALPAQAQISFGVSLPGVQIGINVPVYPRLVRVPGYPVYYDPQADNNYFFYEGQYWVFRDDTWFASSWYNGPWQARQPDDVPLFVLRVPVRYYRQPPGFFRGWRADAAPRWGDHFGRNWQQGHSNWDRWDRRNVPAPAPLPTYQRHYSGEQYPQAPDRQQAVREQHYRYPGREGAQPPPVQAPHAQPQPPRVQPQPRPQPQPQAQPTPPERKSPGNGPSNNPGQGRGSDQGQGRGQDRGPDRGPERGGPPGRGERPDKDPR